jgi:hypothetical protein
MTGATTGQVWTCGKCGRAVVTVTVLGGRALCDGCLAASTLLPPTPAIEAQPILATQADTLARMASIVEGLRQQGDDALRLELEKQLAEAERHVAAGEASVAKAKGRIAALSEQLARLTPFKSGAQAR